jgi:hypothetical protein
MYYMFAGTEAGIIIVHLLMKLPAGRAPASASINYGIRTCTYPPAVVDDNIHLFVRQTRMYVELPVCTGTWEVIQLQHYLQN